MTDKKSEGTVKAEATFDIPQETQDFMRVWEKSDSAIAVDKHFGLEKGKASLKASQLRTKYDIDLKKMKRGKSAINKVEAQRLLASIRNTPLEEAAARRESQSA